MFAIGRLPKIKTKPLAPCRRFVEHVLVAPRYLCWYSAMQYFLHQQHSFPTDNPSGRIARAVPQISNEWRDASIRPDTPRTSPLGKLCGRRSTKISEAWGAGISPLEEPAQTRDVAQRCPCVAIGNLILGER